MSDTSPGSGSAAPSADPADRQPLPALGEKPTISEVADWLRAAAEQRRRETPGHGVQTESHEEPSPDLTSPPDAPDAPTAAEPPSPPEAVAEPDTAGAPAAQAGPEAGGEPAAKSEADAESDLEFGAEPIAAAPAWTPSVPTEPRPFESTSSQTTYPDLDALANELATAPTPVVEQDNETDETKRTAESPRAGLFTLPDELPAEPVVRGVPKIVIPTEAGMEPNAAPAFDLEADPDEAPVDTHGETAPATEATTARRRAPRPRYPRGQIKERIGLLRRLRAVIGITFVAVLLGVVLAGLIGGMILFVFLAGRSAVSG